MGGYLDLLIPTRDIIIVNDIKTRLTLVAIAISDTGMYNGNSKVFNKGPV